MESPHQVDNILARSKETQRGAAISPLRVITGPLYRLPGLFWKIENIPRALGTGDAILGPLVGLGACFCLAGPCLASVSPPSEMGGESGGTSKPRGPQKPHASNPLPYLFIFGGAGSALLRGRFSSWGEWRPLSNCGVRASHCGGLCGVDRRL